MVYVITVYELTPSLKFIESHHVFKTMLESDIFIDNCIEEVNSQLPLNLEDGSMLFNKTLHDDEYIVYRGTLFWEAEYEMVITCREYFTDFLNMTIDNEDFQKIDDWKHISELVCEYGLDFIC
jgi:hypothetical protein